MEYQQIVAATERQFTDEERDIESRQAEVDTAQALLDRRRKALAANWTCPLGTIATYSSVVAGTGRKEVVQQHAMKEFVAASPPS